MRAPRFRRLPDTVQTLYAELLELCIHAEAESVAAGLVPGSFVAKEIAGRTYWYLQTAVGETRSQRYLGRESKQLLGWIRGVEESRARLAPDRETRERLVAMLVRGGAPTEPAGPARVLALLADAGLFRCGGVLVGTQAFRALGVLLGVAFEEQAQRTQDIDVAQHPAVAVALAGGDRIEVEKRLLGGGLGFLPVPGLDPRTPATSFKIRGRELRVDFLAPARGGRERPVRISALGLVAQPLPMLDYLLEEASPAAICAGSGILVHVPEPARFALHKLWLAKARAASEHVKANKDRRQAVALLTVLIEDRPEDLRRALTALGKRRSASAAVREELGRAPAELAERLRGSDIG